MEKAYISVSVTYYPDFAPDAYYYKNDGINIEFYQLDFDTACTRMRELLGRGACSEFSINPYNKAIIRQEVIFFNYL